MQQQQHRGPRLSTSSHSSLTAIPNSVLNGLIPSRRTSQTIPSILSVGSNPSPIQQRHQIIPHRKRFERFQSFLILLSLTLILSFLLILTIEFSTIIIKSNPFHLFFFILSNEIRFNQTEQFILNNQSQFNERNSPFLFTPLFACVWFYNLLLFLLCLFIHLILYQQQCSQRHRARAAFLREFGRIFDGGKSSSRNTLIDYLCKTCLLCFLWYFSCYLLLQSMKILVSSQIMILYSITITLRQVLGWIFLHEEFLGTKIIAHILALSGLLSLAHNDGFRFNRFLLGLTMVVGALSMKTIFDILINGFIKDFENSKSRLVMINVCLCGTCLFWPFVLLLHLTQFELIQIEQFYSFIPILTFICALIYNVLLITIPFGYSSFSSVFSYLLVIPSVSLIDHYFFHVHYPPLVITAILCACAGVLLSIIPKQWFQPGERVKMKQALGFSNKDTNSNATAGLLNHTGTTTGTSSAFEEIRAQRRLRNALLYNEVKT